MRIFWIVLMLFPAFAQAIATDPGHGLRPTWAHKAVAFPSRCEIDSNTGASNARPRYALETPPPTPACRVLKIPAPDGKKSVVVRYRKAKWDSASKTIEAYLEVRSGDGVVRKASLPAGFQDIDLLWSPDSNAFFINWGNGGGYWGFELSVYLLNDPKLGPIRITHAAQRDMVKAFPPCKASQLDEETCKEIEKQPDYNMSGIDWGAKSSSVIVMAEVPCSGGHGGIMCQVLGYEIEVPTGKILRRMTAREFKREWQKSMAFRFHVPDPPIYCEKGNPENIPDCIGHRW